MAKGGKFTKDELSFIMQNMDLDDKQLAQALNRKIETIQKTKAQIIAAKEEDNISPIIMDLMQKFFWPETIQQLINNDEIIFFKNYWAKLYDQFSAQGVLATDEMMMRDLIMTEIQLNRCQRERKRVASSIQTKEVKSSELHQQLREERNQEEPDANMINFLATEISSLNSDISALRAANKALADEWKVIQEKKDKKFEALKATRQLRLDKVEKANQTFFDLVKLLDDKEMRENEGRVNELNKMAGIVAKHRYEELTEFEDGNVDRVMLTPEAVENE